MVETESRFEVSGQAVDFVRGFRFDDAPDALRDVARRHILDTLGVMISGRREPPAQIGLHHVRAMAGEGTAFAAPFVAFLLGLRGHVQDYDDTQLATWPEAVYGLLTHPSVPVLAAALAVAAAQGKSGRDLFAAFIAATEAECRISDAIFPRHYQDGFHSSGTVGTLAAALAAAKLLDLDEATTRIALSIAASSAAGLRENFGTMTKPLHVGRAAQHGVEAAYLARAGWTAAPDILEARRGFYRAFGGGFEPSRIDGKLGNPWYYLDPGVSIKPHPSGSLTHPAMWVIGELVKTNDIAAGDVEHVTVGTNSNMPNALIHHRPKDPLAAKFSMEYAAATMIVRRRGGLAEYDDPQAVLNPTVQAMIERVDFRVDPVAEEAGFHRMLSRIRIRLRDGRELTGEGDAGRGHPHNAMTDEEVLAKFTDCARWGGLADSGARVRRIVENLEETGDLGALVHDVFADGEVRRSR